MATNGLSEGLREEIQYGAATLTVLEEGLRDRVAHLVVFTQAAERAAQEVFELIERISEKVAEYKAASDE
jgi:hypothetical protein